MSARTVTIEGGYPFDLAQSLDFYRRHGDDLLDRFDGTTFARAVPQRDATIPLAITVPTATTATTVAGLHRMDADTLTELATAQFLYNPAALDALARQDPAIAAILPHHGAVAILRQPNLFHALVRCISAQQINLAWAAVTRARLTHLVGDELALGGHHVYSLNPDKLADTPIDTMRALQISSNKARYLKAAAVAVASGSLRVDALATLTDDRALDHLRSVPGIGTWSAEWILIRTLGRPRVTAGDLVVRKAIGWLYHINTPTEADVRALTAHWGPASALAQTCLLEAYHHRSTANLTDPKVFVPAEGDRA